jgi:ferredoxin|tara:strand:+ start:409 stop:765 length:357 start_codon:yes stop_codon:yes gene_type:complete
MTYLVLDNCVKCKHMDCVEVCPVDCFYEGENMLVINPDECIDCGVCEPECPVDAIVPDNSFNDPSEAIRWEEINRQYSLIWPVITTARPDDVPKDAAEWNGVPNKFEDHFDPAPGKGD